MPGRVRSDEGRGAERDRARPSLARQAGPRGRADPSAGPRLAYLRRPPGSPPLPGRPRRGPPAPQPPAAPTSAAGSASASAAGREWLRKQPKAERVRRRRRQRAGRSRGGPAGRKRQCASPRTAPATLGSRGWRRGRGERDCVLLIAGF